MQMPTNSKVKICGKQTNKCESRKAVGHEEEPSVVKSITNSALALRCI